jgi:hypothetical protein
MILDDLAACGLVTSTPAAIRVSGQPDQLDTCWPVTELAACTAGTAPGTRDDLRMTEDAMISLLSGATHIACRQLTAQHLNALHASVDQASCLAARPD